MSGGATSTRLRLLDNGWNPIPVIGKKPDLIEWQRHCVEPPTEDEIESWAIKARYAESTGLACGRVCVAIDIDVVSDAELSRQVQGLAASIFGSTPFLRVGLYPKIAMIYRPDGDDIATRRFKAADGSGDGVDILSTGSQFVAFGNHPDTGQPYQWVGDASPLDAGPEDAPAITQAQIDRFLDDVHALLPLASDASKAGKARGTGAGLGTIVRDSAGRVVDGREAFLTRCVWKATCALDAAGEPLESRVIADRAWAMFSAEADLSDGRWKPLHADRKARGTVRRVRAGLPLYKTRPLAEPNYPAASERADDVRIAIREAMRDWVSEPGTTVPVLRTSTGTSKTGMFHESVAAHGDGRRFAHLVPTLALAEEAALSARDAHGIAAGTFRGREADDPAYPLRSGHHMCLDMPAVKAALAAGAAVQETCCAGKNTAGEEVRCAFFDRCAYQRQKADKPTILAGAHEYLFTAGAGFEAVDAVVVDESFWPAGVFGVGPEDEDGKRAKPLAVDAFQNAELPKGHIRAGALDDLRTRLARGLRANGTGGLKQSALVSEGITAADASDAIKLEYAMKEAAAMWPGMPLEERKAAAKAAMCRAVTKPTTGAPARC